MSILGGVEEIHNNLNTYTTEDIKVFKFSTNEWGAIIDDDDYSLLQPIRDWRALGKTPIIEMPAGVFGMSGGRSISFIYLHLIAVAQSSEETMLSFEAVGENAAVAAFMECRGTNVIDFNIHTAEFPVISGNTVDGELLTIDGAELKTSGISVSDLEDVISSIDDVNTKTFYLSSTSDLTNAQAAYDWYKAGKNPIIRISGWNYSFILEGNNSEPTYHLGFYGVNGGANDGTSNSSIGINPRLELRYSSDTVTSVVVLGDNAHVLFTDVNYSTPYTPAYNGSPATKKYVDDSVSGAISAGTTAPSNPTEGQIWYDTTNDVLKTYDGTNWVEVGKEYSAGENITINQNNEISAIDTTYNAGEGIEIGTYNDYSAMRGPCPRGFHVPTNSELQNIINIGNTLSAWSTPAQCESILNLTNHNKINWLGGYIIGLNGAYIWSCTPNNSGQSYAFSTTANQIQVKSTENRNNGYQIRPFKDKPVVPDNTRTTLVDGSSIATGAGIFSNPLLGLISLSNDGINWTTIAIKNLGAPDTTSAGYYYQWGNNNGFVANGYTTSETTVDASNYGPMNYYNSNVFIMGNNGVWDSSNNRNLRGGLTGVATIENAISNIGVLSVNGQTGDVVIDTSEASSITTTQPSNPVEGDVYYDTTNDVLKIYDGTNWNVVGDDSADVNTKTFFLSNTSDTTTGKAIYDRWNAGKNPIIIYNKETFYIAHNNSSSSLRMYSFDAVPTSQSGGQLDGQTLFYISRLVISTSGAITYYNKEYSYIGDISNITIAEITTGTSTAKRTITASVLSKAIKTLSTSASSTAPSNPTEGQLWYDTTNDVLKVYNGTAWVEVGGGITNDTTGTTSTISQEWVGTKAEFEALSSYGDKIYNITE